MAIEFPRKIKKDVLIVIPARMKSERFPGKPLAMAEDQPLVHWTYAQAKQTKADHVVVATPDREIGRYCQEHQIEWMATSEHHPNGTSRCLEILERTVPEFRCVINWQVDEPCLSWQAVNELIDETLSGHCVRTFCAPPEPGDLEDPNTTKVVHSNVRCHWFSRAPMAGADVHVGIYSFHPASAILRELMSLPISRYSQQESLEQLTWLEAGFEIRPIPLTERPLSINILKDWEKFKRMLKECEVRREYTDVG